jgi:hypothetical protein
MRARSVGEPLAMRLEVLGVLMAVALVAPVHAQTEGFTGNRWLDWCSKKQGLEGAVHYGGCLGYVNGLRDGLDILRGFARENAIVCIPKKVDTRQLVDVGKRFMDRHPEKTS